MSSHLTQTLRSTVRCSMYSALIEYKHRSVIENRKPELFCWHWDGYYPMLEVPSCQTLKQVNI
jgi:hypothetical protein